MKGIYRANRNRLGFLNKVGSMQFIRNYGMTVNLFRAISQTARAEHHKRDIKCKFSLPLDFLL